MIWCSYIPHTSKCNTSFTVWCNCPHKKYWVCMFRKTIQHYVYFRRVIGSIRVNFLDKSWTNQVSKQLIWSWPSYLKKILVSLSCNNSPGCPVIGVVIWYIAVVAPAALWAVTLKSYRLSALKSPMAYVRRGGISLSTVNDKIILYCLSHLSFPD